MSIRGWGHTGLSSAVVVLALTGASCNVESAGAPEPGRATVARIVDGDTIEVHINDQTVLVRLLGVDAPETVHPTRPEQCFGREAADRLGELLPVGSEVTLSRDQEARDHFDRLLLYVHGPDGVFVNKWLLDQGLASLALYEPNTHYRIAFTRAAIQAERGQIGLWGACEGPDQPLP